MWVWLQHVLLLLVTGFGLSVASVLGPTFDFDAFSLDLFSGDSDDLGSGYEASSFVLPSVINNTSKEDAIDEYIIVDEDGDDHEEDDNLYVKVEAHSVDGSGGSGSGDHDEFIQNEMLNVVDVDDVGSGEAVDEEAHGSGEAVLEEAQGSGSEDENDVGSVEILGGDVVNGYRIMGVSSNQVAPDNSVEESSLEVNVEAAESPESPESPEDVTEAAEAPDLAVDVTEAVFTTEWMETWEKPEDDYPYSYDYDYNYNYDIDYEEEEGEDIHEILDYLNLVETTTPPEEDIIDYLNSMEIAEPLTIPRTEEEVMERKWDEFDDDLDEHEMTMSEHLDDWNKFSEHDHEMMISGAGSKQATVLIVVISFVIAPLFWI